MLHSPTEWDEADLLTLVREGVEEGPELEYKRCAALQRNDEKRKFDISKDVSALANSGGGTIVYGMIEEGNVPKGLDQGFDPIEISKEWLEQVILGTIRPRLNDITINPVNLRTHASGRVAYVVHVPQSHTAHQASDKKYYKRFNFQATPMEDYEIRDIMNRKSHPILLPIFTRGRPYSHPGNREESFLFVTLKNRGTVRAQHFKLVFTIPEDVARQAQGFIQRGITQKDELFGNSWMEHIFATTQHVVFPDDEIHLEDFGYKGQISLDKSIDRDERRSVFLYWRVFADDMPPSSGQVYLGDISYK